MTTAMPILETPRLIVRPFTLNDLETVHRILDLEAQMEPGSLQEREEWLEWTVRNYEALARLFQPPFGDRAVERKKDGGPHAGQLVGSVGLVPAVGPFGILPPFKDRVDPRFAQYMTVEFGMFWALGNDYRGNGYATEAAQALVNYAFREMRLARIIATTEYTNLESQRVMERLGMRLEHSSLAEPEWFQVVGILENPLE